MKKFLHKTVFITGGGSWIGKEMANQFALQAANVFIVGRNEEKLKATCDEITSQGGIASYTVADVANEESIKGAINLAYKKYGHLDIIIPNAAIYTDTELTKITLNDWNEVLSINLTGAFLTIKLAAPFIQKSQNGRIIFISSIGGDPIGVKGYGHYCASKAGINGLMRSAALEFAKNNITVNCISPGNICNLDRFQLSSKDIEDMLAQIPLGRIGQPIDVANLALFLASNEANFITGQTFIVDGGECCA